MNKATTKLIGDLINAIDTSYEVDNVVDNGDGTFTLSVKCSTKWLRPCAKIDIDGFTFQITDMVADESITIKPIKNSHVPLVGTYNAPTPIYFYGTIRMVNGQLNAIGNSSGITPMIYFVEIYEEEYDVDPESAIDYETDITLLFMDDSNYEDWAKAEEHYDGAIIPMRSLVQEFLNAVDKSGKIAQLDTNFRIIPHSNFGVFQNNQGHVRRLLEAELSGCELRITLPICKNLTCENKC